MQNQFVKSFTLSGYQWSPRLILGILCMLICLLPEVSLAQETKPANPANKTKPKKEIPPGASAHMSVVALGPVPQRRYKMPSAEDLKDFKDLEDIESAAWGDTGKGKGRPEANPGARGIPIPLPPLSGAVPPSTLFYKLPKAPSNGSPWARVRVGFNNATSVTKVHAGIPLDLHYIDHERKTGYLSFLKLPPLEPWSQVVVFLTPSGKGKTPWKNGPTVSVLNLRSQALINKNVLVRNFSNEAVAFMINDQKPVELTAGHRASFSIAKKEGFHRVAAIKVRGKVPVLRTSVRFPERSLSVIAFYNANPATNGGKDVGVLRSTFDKVSPAELQKKMTIPKP